MAPAPAPTQTPLPPPPALSKDQSLARLAALDEETLQILAELSSRPDLVKKLKRYKAWL